MVGTVCPEPTPILNLASARRADTTSTSTPPRLLGWRKATRVPCAPGRGCASINRTPAASQRARAARRSSTSRLDVVQSRAPRVEELGHGVIGAQRLEQLERDGPKRTNTTRRPPSSSISSPARSPPSAETKTSTNGSASRTAIAMCDSARTGPLDPDAALTALARLAGTMHPEHTAQRVAHLAERCALDAARRGSTASGCRRRARRARAARAPCSPPGVALGAPRGEESRALPLGRGIGRERRWGRGSPVANMFTPTTTRSPASTSRCHAVRGPWICCCDPAGCDRGEHAAEAVDAVEQLACALFQLGGQRARPSTSRRAGRRRR